MNISILSVFPDLYTEFLKTSLLKRAQDKGLVTFIRTSFFAYVAPNERIDAPSYGHGAGMLIRPQVVERAVADLELHHGKAFKIFFSPQGKKLDQKLLRSLAAQIQTREHLMLLPARYEGMDARVEHVYADAIISLGDFVLMAGDLPAMVFLEGFLRLLPGVVGKQESVTQESFTGPFLDYPEYTAPVAWRGCEVPEVVRSGNHGALQQWRLQQAVRKTVLEHFDWVRSHALSESQAALVVEHIPAHYVVLMHTDVLIGKERVEGTTSVTSLDIHDIARSSATYGIKQFFIVTPHEDQQKLVATLLDFWQHGPGIAYNRVRHDAVKSVSIAPSLNDVLATIEALEKKSPLMIATSARSVHHSGGITFNDQGAVWQQERPVLFVFGTGQGLTPACLERCDFVLPPVGGPSLFRHLSVRSAVAIILDRWLGFSLSR